MDEANLAKRKSDFAKHCPLVDGLIQENRLFKVLLETHPNS